jgi:hypothetical protein
VSAPEVGQHTVESPWGQEALSVILSMPNAFSANDIWKAGLTVPPNKMWLGNVMRHAHSTGRIRRVGWDKSDLTHGSVISKWEVVTQAEDVAA